MAIGAIVGGACQFLVQAPSAHRAGFRYRFILDFADPGVRHIVKLMLPAVVGLSATQINITVDNQLASRFGNGPVSWLNYAFRLMQLPIGIFGVAIATATLAAVSHHAAQNAMAKLRNTVTSSLRLAACLTFPSTVGLIVFRKEIVKLLYERGFFLASDTVETSRVLFLYALALFAYSAVKIVVPTFYALNDTKTPVRASMFTVAVKVAINFVLIVPLGYLGLALATAIASWLNFGILLRQLLLRTGGSWGWRDYYVFLRIALSSVLMGIVALLAYRLSEQIIPLSGRWALAASLGVAIAVGVGLTLVLLRILGVEEARDLTRILTKKFSAGRS
jgi:putative peptidoglycan lipid II flippase